jgi:hypothetical protein
MAPLTPELAPLARLEAPELAPLARLEAPEAADPETPNEMETGEGSESAIRLNSLRAPREA